MEDELKSLKEILDDTYYKDMALSKSQKKKILKKAVSSSKTSRIVPNLKYALSLVAAISCVLVLGLSMVLPKSSQSAITDKDLHEKQVAIIHFQNHLVKLVKNQQIAEEALIDEIDHQNRDSAKERYRTEILKEGEKITKQMKQITVPPELYEYEDEINQSLNELIISYKQKNEFYRTVDFYSFKGISPSDETARHFFNFSKQIGKVYTNLELFQPSYYILLEFYVR